MRPRLRLLAVGSLALALTAGAYPLTNAVADDKPDPATTARRHLTQDAEGPVRVVGDRSGRVAFVGTSAGRQIDNPDVSPRASVAEAARQHLNRYGAVLGARGNASFVRRSTRHATSGVDVVAYAQEIGGVPVIGGDVVVSLGPDRGLRSIQSTISGVGAAGPATIAEDDAAARARGLVVRSLRGRALEVTSAGRWLLDPEVTGLALPSGARTVWRFEVGDGAGVRQLVLVDDHTGQVLLRSDLIEHADPDRVVCDQANTPGWDDPCTSGFAREEGDPETGDPDVDNAYDLSGAVSSFYQQIAGVSLTSLLGVDVGGVKKLASTVRFCTPFPADGCPYENAFWNGQQMFYGEGWADADDVVGHEMTHGFIDQYSRLFYWGQSGAINESMADVIGEIVDHRHPTTGDSSVNWDLGEDSPVGTIRSLSDPTSSFLGQPGQPDKMTSGLYDPDSGYLDNGGVHTNSGVGNKTAYLISQGGTFNGQTITGIDGSDINLAKTAKLYVDVIERLSSGADYAALAQQLDQSCQDLRASAGFTAADCVAVHQAGVATELTTTPTNAAQPADATTGCPAGFSTRVLFDSESGDPASKFIGSAGWMRTTDAGLSNATSGTASWFAADPETTHAYSLRTSSEIQVPTGQPTYLSFQGWYLLDYEPNTYYDGGTVEISANGNTPASVASLPWENGPSLPLASPNSGRLAFAGDSLGWTRSRVDLSSYAGSYVRPQFTMRSDSIVGYIGWYLDDITVYTCDPAPISAVQGLTVDGFISGMTVRWTPPAVNPQHVTGYQVHVAQCPQYSKTLPPTATSARLVISSQLCGGRVDLSISPMTNLLQGTTSATVTTWLGMASVRARRFGKHLRFRGTVGTVEPRRVVGGVVRISRKTATGWVVVRTVTTGSNGAYTAWITRRKPALYRVAYLGGPFLIGSHHKDLRL